MKCGHRELIKIILLSRLATKLERDAPIRCSLLFKIILRSLIDDFFKERQAWIVRFKLFLTTISWFIDYPKNTNILKLNFFCNLKLITDFTLFFGISIRQKLNDYGNKLIFYSLSSTVNLRIISCSKSNGADFFT